VTLVDTSAWVEFLRGTGSPADRQVTALVRAGDGIATTDTVVMEILAGARDDAHRDRLRGLLARCHFAPTEGPRDFEDAAGVYRTCRRGGETIRALTDCLIATVAIREGMPILHADADFDAIARHVPLTIAG
jgi:predicted nucleic acid-binding protein